MRRRLIGSTLFANVAIWVYMAEKVNFENGRFNNTL